jgi:hypothetical protein
VWKQGGTIALCSDGNTQHMSVPLQLTRMVKAPAAKTQGWHQHVILASIKLAVTLNISAE